MINRKILYGYRIRNGSVMLTDVKENGAVMFLGKLYNTSPVKSHSPGPLTATHPHSHTPQWSYHHIFQVTAHLYAASSL